MRNLDIKEVIFKFRWYILSISISVVLLILGVVSLAKQLPFLEDNKIEILSAETENKEAIIEISGAVEKPGVYKLTTNSRVDDVLISAGGLSVNADRDWIAKTLNRAAKITDGQKIYIPEKGSTSFTGSTSTTGTIARDTLGTLDTRGTLININSASTAELDKLPGVGPVTAQKIIDNRPYSAVEELITRKILKQKVYEDIKNKVSIY
ncbi:helix-hairpin-helix domain-containing protein [Candidatus Microgenomates bacterium]|nr:helix-hairpin-helix domain-containing protein [Candidatus Microgenomates bacterium]